MTDRKRLPLWPIAAVVFLAAFAAFWPSLSNGFVNWDDDLNLTSNPGFRGLGWTQLRWMFTTAHDGNYMPLCWLTFALDHALWGLAPRGYHLTNMLLHASSAVLVFFIARRLLEAASGGADPGPALPLAAALSGEGARQPFEDGVPLAAAFAALFFSVHPLRVESVAWATERKDTLSGFFYLWTVLLHLKACSAEPGRRLRWRLLSLAAYLTSLLSKGVGATLPVALLILDVYPLRRLSGGPRRWGSPEARGVWLEKLPYLALAVPFGVAGAIGQRTHAWSPTLEEYGILERGAEAVTALFFYLRKTAFPSHLSVFYPIPWPFDPLAPRYLLNAGAALGLTVLFAAWRRRRPYLLAAWLFYALTLSLTSGLFQFGSQFAADHYSYLPSLPAAVLAGAGVLWLLRRRRPWVRGAAAAACAVLLCLLAGRTWARTRDVWRDSESLWSDALREDPGNGLAHHYLGMLLEQRGAVQEAVREYLLSIRSDPRCPFPHQLLARILEQQGRFAEAERHLRLALSLSPRSPTSRFVLAGFLSRRGRAEEAAALYKQALPRLDGFRIEAPAPSAARPASGATDRELSAVQQAARARPGDAVALAALAARYASQGRWDEAVSGYREALRLRPDYADARNNLGSALAAQGRIREAIPEFQEAVRLAPRDVMSRYNLGNAYLMEKRFAEAAAQYEEVLRLVPSHPRALQNLEIARFYLRQTSR